MYIDDEDMYHVNDGTFSILSGSNFCQVLENDPLISRLKIFWLEDWMGSGNKEHAFAHDNVDWENSHCVANNTHIKTLVLEDIESVPKSFANFCHGMTKNNSIESIGITTGVHEKTMILLAPFIKRNHNLRSLYIGGEFCTMKAKNFSSLASTLSHGQSNLKSITITCKLSDRSSGVLITSFAHCHSLSEITLCNGHIKSHGSAALAHFLKKSSCNIRKLNLQNEKIDNKGLVIIADALAANTSLKVLNLGYNVAITSRCWMKFFNALVDSSLALEELYLSSNSIEDSAIAALGHVLIDMHSLKSLWLDHIRTVSSKGWKLFSVFQSSPMFHLNKLVLNGSKMNSEAIGYFTGSLFYNNSLQHLSVKGMEQYGTLQPQTLLTRLNRTGLALQHLCISGYHVSDCNIETLGGILLHNPSLLCLHLEGPNQVSARGWHAFSRFLARPDMRLQTLVTDCFSIDEEAMSAIVHSLATNVSLKSWRTKDGPIALSKNALRLLATVLWDKSSIDATFNSNHSFQEVCCDSGSEDIPPILSVTLLLNKFHTRASAARYKILRSHFLDKQSYNKNIWTLLKIPVTALPLALGWLSQDDYGLHVVYHLLLELFFQ